LSLFIRAGTRCPAACPHTISLRSIAFFGLFLLIPTWPTAARRERNVIRKFPIIESRLGPTRIISSYWASKLPRARSESIVAASAKAIPHLLRRCSGKKIVLCSHPSYGNRQFRASRESSAGSGKNTSATTRRSVSKPIGRNPNHRRGRRD